jgi:transcription initiation factor TFIIA small subunit
MSEPRNYELYRNSSLGVSLKDTVDELITHNQVSAELGYKVLLQFDKSFCTLLATKVKNKSNFKV